MSIRRLTYFVCLSAVLAGCRNYEGPRRFPLSGKVTCDNEPIDVGSISFLPLGENQRVSGGPIVDGNYSVSEAQGAFSGKHRIEIRWQKRTGKKIKYPYGEEDVRAEGLPPKYHQDSTLTVDVSANQTSFDFDLKSSSGDARKAGKSESAWGPYR